MPLCSHLNSSVDCVKRLTLPLRTPGHKEAFGLDYNISAAHAVPYAKLYCIVLYCIVSDYSAHLNFCTTCKFDQRVKIGDIASNLKKPLACITIL